MDVWEKQNVNVNIDIFLLNCVYKESKLTRLKQVQKCIDLIPCIADFLEPYQTYSVSYRGLISIWNYLLRNVLIEFTLKSLVYLCFYYLVCNKKQLLWIPSTHSVVLS